MEEYIREYPSKLIIGIIETLPNGDQTARLFPTREIVGYYRASRNVTTNFIGQVLTTGNTVVNLIYQRKK